MADFEASLRTYLIAQSGVTSVFGASNTRVYIDRKDEAISVTYPYAIIRTVTSAPDYAHDGALPDSGTFQIDIYSDVKSTANSGSDAIRTELDGYSGTMGSVTAGAAFIVDVRGGYDPDTRTFYRSLDVQIAQSG